MNKARGRTGDRERQNRGEADERGERGVGKLGIANPAAAIDVRQSTDHHLALLVHHP